MSARSYAALCPRRAAAVRSARVNRLTERSENRPHAVECTSTRCIVPKSERHTWVASSGASMRTSLRSAILFSVVLGSAAPLSNAGDVSVGVTISGEITPGVYGRVDLSNRPPPPLVYATPVVIVRPPPRVVLQPIYLHVPPGHARNWGKHCAEY